MSLLDQIDRVAGHQVPVVYAADVRQFFGMSKSEFYTRMEQRTRQVDIRAFVAGGEKTSGPLLVIISDYRGGLLIQLWELRE